MSGVSGEGWACDLNEMHCHYGFHEKIEGLTDEQLAALLSFRIMFLNEELRELREARSAEDVVDALIDLIVVAIGTLDLFDINSEKAWEKVHTANMAKEVGIKESRPNPLGLPDLIKPDGWEAPSHEGNHGTLTRVFPKG